MCDEIKKIVKETNDKPLTQVLVMQDVSKRSL